MNCFRLTKTNKEESQLFNTLFNIVKDENEADRLYSYFREPSFIEIFGDYNINYKSKLEDESFNDRIDINGEPKLFFNKRLNKHYFLDKNNEPIFYPYTQQGIRQSLNTNDIKLFSKILASDFYLKNIDFNFDTLQFTKKSTKLLRQSIKEFLDKKITELQNNEDPDLILKGFALEETQEYLNEWVQEVKNYFSTLNIKYNSLEEKEDQFDQEESSNDDLMRKESFLKSSKNNVNTNIRLFLSLIQTNELNDFNEFNFIDFDEIYNTLNSSLSNLIALEGEDIYEIYLDKVKELINVKPYFETLYDELLKYNKNDNFKNQFSSSFNLFKNNFLASEKSIIDGKIFYDVRNISDVSSKKNNIISAWTFNFNQKNLGDASLTTIDKQLKSDLLYLNKKQNTIKDEVDLLPFLNNLKKSLNDLGVEYTQKGFDLFLNDLQYDELPLSEKIKNLISSYKKVSYAIKFGIDTKKDIFLNQSLFKELAEAEAFFIKEGSDASVFTMGKTKWVYSLPSYLDLKVAKWKKDPNILYKHFISTPYNRGSEYMKYLTASEFKDPETRLQKSKERLDKIEVSIFNSVQSQGDSLNAVDNKSISYTDSLVDYTNKILAGRKGNKVYHKTAIAADKATEYQIHFGDNNFFIKDSNAILIKDIDNNPSKNKIKVNDEVLEIFYNYFKSEYQRMLMESKVITKGKNLIPNYHTKNKNSLKSQLFPSLSVKFEGNKVILPSIEGLTLYSIDGFPIYDNLDVVKDKVKEVINKSIEKGINTTYTLLFNNNVFSLNEAGIRENNAIDSNIYKYYVEKAGVNYAPLQIAADLFINSVISQVEYSKMFTGDIAYYKNIVDYKKRVPETYTDGLYMRLNNIEDRFFNASIISSVEIDAPSLEAMKKYLPKSIWNKYSGGKVNATDAQAWITPQRWKFIMEKLGKWDNIVDSAYKKMFKNKPEYSKEELKVLAQPLKGVYFDINEKGIPIYLKYSQAVLVPNLIKGTGLETLFNKMTKNGNKTLPFNEQTHELITNDGIKVGFPQPTTVHNDEAEVITNIELSPIKLENASWKLQQDLPTKGIKPTDIGSQIQKVIFQGLAFNLNKTFSLPDRDLSGDEFINYINELTDNLSNRGKLNLLNRFGINPDNYKIENEDALYSSLIKQLKSRKDVPSNFILALEAGLSPYGIPGAFQMFQNVFSSTINKELVKIQTNGGGFIQMSDFGINQNEAEEQNVIFTPWFKDKNLSAPKIIGKNEETGNDIIEPAGIFISGSFIAKYVPNYKSLTSEKLFGTYNTKTKQYSGGLIDQEILKNIIGYRIPNQGLSSNDALQVMGILPESMGDTIVAYTGITTKTGSDFDIDKMYLMIPSFSPVYPKSDYSKGSQYIKDRGIQFSTLKDSLKELGIPSEDLDRKLVYDLFIEEILFNDVNEGFNEYYNDFHNNYELSDTVPVRLKYSKPVFKDGQELPLYQQSKQVIQNKIIEAYKTVLLHPDVIEDVMNPIDLDYIEKDIKDLFPDEQSDDLMDFDAVSDLKLKNEFRLGKSGLGQNVNSLVDSVRGSMADLYFLENLGWGIVENDQSVLDREYSEDLEATDLKMLNEYVERYNRDKSEEDKITIKDISKIKLNDSMTMLVNGFVDIAKDPFIVKGNWVTQTNNLGFLLLRLGVHPFKVNAFLGQPILKEYVNFRSNQESKTINETNNITQRFKLLKTAEEIPSEEITINRITLTKRNLFNVLFTPRNVRKIGEFSEVKTEEDFENYKERKEDFVKYLNESLLEKFKLDSPTDLSNDLRDEFGTAYEKIFEADKREFLTISLKELRDEIKNESNIDIQLAVLDRFEYWMDYSKKLAASVNASKVDVNGKGKNINSLITSVNRIQNILNSKDDKELQGFKTKLYRDGKNTLLNTAISNSLGFSYEIMKANPKYFFSANNTTISTFNSISNFLYGKRLENDNLADKLEKAYYTYITSNFPALSVTKEESSKLLKDVIKSYFSIKNELKDNTFLNELFVKSSTGNRTFLSMPNIKKSVSFKNEITDSWRDLFQSHPEFAEKLVKYSYLISGFNNNLNQFHEYIPYEWFNKNGFNSYLKELTFDYKNFIDRAFIDQFFRNNYSDDSILRTEFRHSIKPLDTGDNFKTGYITKKQKKVTPYLTKIDFTYEEETFSRYYKLIGKNSDGLAVYIRTSLLSYKDNKANRVLEYSLGNNALTSIFEDNNVNSNEINGSLYNKVKNEYKIIDELNTDMIVRDVESKELTTNVALLENIEEDIFKNKVEENLDNSEKNSILEQQKLDAELKYLKEKFDNETAELYFKGIEELPEENKKELKIILDNLDNTNPEDNLGFDFKC